MRSTFLVLTSVLCVLLSRPAMAQVTWQDFPPAQSRLRLFAPGLSEQPSKAMEFYGDPSLKGTRQFLYIWNDNDKRSSYALVNVGLIAAELYSFPTFSDADIRSAILRMTESLGPSIPPDRFLDGVSPVGGIRYQRLTLAKLPQKQCFAFGATMGGVYFSAPSSAGVLPGGDKRLMGVYCAPNGETLSEFDIQTVLAGLAFDDLKPSDVVRRTASEHRYSRLK